MKRPPAFQFYAKDWSSSPTIRAMSMRHRGVFISVLAAMWDSDDPGTLPLPIKIASKSAGLDHRSLIDFVSKWPRCLVEVDGKLVNHKLRGQWLEMRQRQQALSDAGVRGNERKKLKASGGGMGGVRSASASASASATSTSKEQAYVNHDFIVIDARPPAPVADQRSLIPDSKLRPADLVECWNTHCGNLPHVEKLTEERARRAKVLLRSAGFSLDYFQKVVLRAARSPFLTGAGAKGWRADFDFVLKPTNCTKILEGSYDDRKVKPGDAVARMVASLREEHKAVH